MNARWARLHDGSWGVRVEGGTPTAGAAVTVTKRDGSTAEVTLGALVSSGSGYVLYKVPPRARRGEAARQPDSERTGTTYAVTVRVTNASGDFVQWELPIESTDEFVTSETSIEIARVALHVHDVLAGERTASAPKKAAAPKRRSATRKAA